VFKRARSPIAMEDLNNIFSFIFFQRIQITIEVRRESSKKPALIEVGKGSSSECGVRGNFEVEK
jgi:hypothetical protein